MEKKELMIGDWVYNKNIDKPMQVYPMMFSQMFRQKPDATTEDYNIFPIPLTAEILEKNGFTRFGTGYILKDRHFGLENPSTPGNYLDNYWLRVSIKAVRIEFIHELQHAIRLCGIEKEIEL